MGSKNGRVFSKSFFDGTEKTFRKMFEKTIKKLVVKHPNIIVRRLELIVQCEAAKLAFQRLGRGGCEVAGAELPRILSRCILTVL
jgi:hypothetical protein